MPTLDVAPVRPPKYPDGVWKEFQKADLESEPGSDSGSWNRRDDLFSGQNASIRDQGSTDQE